MKQTITKTEYLQLVGLHALATRHNDTLKDILETANTLVGEDPGDTCGHIGDLIYGSNRDVDETLRKMRVVVEGGAP